VKFKNSLYRTFIQPNMIPELNAIEEVKDGVKVGAAVTLNNLGQFLKIQIETQPGMLMHNLLKYLYVHVCKYSLYTTSRFSPVR